MRPQADHLLRLSAFIRMYGHCFMVAMVFLTLRAVVWAQEAGGVPVWMSLDGKAIRAEFGGLSGENVTLIINGKRTLIPMARLALGSRQQALKLAEGMAAASGLMPVPQHGAGRIVVEPLSEGGKPSPLGLIALPPEMAQADEVVGVTVAKHHALALTSEGRVISWGREAEDLPPLPPEMLGGEKRIVQVIAGTPDAVLREDGSVAMSRDTEQLSIPPGLIIRRIGGTPPALFAFDASNHITYIGPRRLAAVMEVPAEIRNEPIRLLEGAEENALAVTAKGKLLVWGINGNGLPVVPEDLSKRMGRGDTVAAACIRSDIVLVLQKSGKSFCWGPAAKWYGASVADAANPLTIHWMEEEYWSAFVIQRQKGNSKGYAFYAKTTERNAYLTKLFRRHNPSALAAGKGAVVMITPSARKQ